MSITPNYVPRNYKTINVFLLVRHAEKAIEFYNSAFGADVEMILKDTEGKIVHAELKIADTMIMLAEDPETTPSRSNVVLQLYVGDVEGIFEDAVNAGAEVLRPIRPEFYGDRVGKIRDPFGHEWLIATHMEDLTAIEIQGRFNQLQS